MAPAKSRRHSPFLYVLYIYSTITTATLILKRDFFYDQDRVRAQIWSYMPVQRLSQNFLLDERLVSLGGVQLDCIPVSVLLYGGLAAVALVTCIWLCKARAVDKM